MAANPVGRSVGKESSGWSENGEGKVLTADSGREKRERERERLQGRIIMDRNSRGGEMLNWSAVGISHLFVRSFVRSFSPFSIQLLTVSFHACARQGRFSHSQCRFSSLFACVHLKCISVCRRRAAEKRRRDGCHLSTIYLTRETNISPAPTLTGTCEQCRYAG